MRRKHRNVVSFHEVQAETFNSFASRLSAKDFFKEDVALGKEYKLVLDLMENLKDKTVLDVGCGTGRYALRIARKARQVVGIDISKDSIAYARKVARQAGIHNFIGEINSFTRPKYDRLFDYILMVNTIHHVQDIDLLLKNARRALKDSGRLVILEFNPVNPLFIPFLAVQKQVRSHLNGEYFRSNLFTLNGYLKKAGWETIRFRRYAFLPTMLYNYSLVFERLNFFLNRLPIVNLFCAFHLIECGKAHEVID